MKLFPRYIIFCCILFMKFPRASCTLNVSGTVMSMSLFSTMVKISGPVKTKNANSHETRSVYQHFSTKYVKILVCGTLVVKFKHTILWWSTANLLVFIAILYYILKPRKTSASHAHKSGKKLNFLTKDTWRDEVSKMKIDADLLALPTIKGYPKISLALAKLTDLILREFIDSWFTKISTDSLFQDAIRVELRHVFANLSARVATIDIPNMLVHRIIPAITDHYSQFTNIGIAYDSSYSIESKLNVAKRFNKGIVHEGVSMKVPGSGPSIKEKNFLRAKVKSILPFLLSSQEKSNGLVTSLLTEVLACTVLTNAFSVLSEGDFFNQLIVKIVGANLRHRNQVKRLREALQQHTTHTPDDTLHVNGSLSLPTLRSPITSEYMAAWSSKISKINSARELQELRGALQNEQASLDPSSSLYSHNHSRISKLLSMIPQSPSKDQKFQNLESVLAEPKHAAVFREFLRTSKHEVEVDLWQHIERMRAPLEGADTSEIPLFLEFSNEDDIVKIYEKYFLSSFLEISDLIRKTVSSYVQNDNLRDVALYQQARQALFELQNDIFLHMKTVHLEQFQMSSRFGDLDTMLPKKSMKRVVSTAFPLTETDENARRFEPEEYQESHVVSSAVVHAVESAFENIMSSSAIDSGNRLLTHHLAGDLNIKSTVSRKSSQSSLFGDTSIPLNNSVFGLDINNLNRLSALFEVNGDADLDSNSLSESVDSNDSTSQSFSNLELLLAAPGDLSLAEKISVLDLDIENLIKQNEVLLSLLKKAELINNVTELKILRRSNSSLEKEINTKELQKQQYIVQENDNSLYGKSKVRIQSCVFGRDENLTYVMYVIEVQKYSSEDPNEIVAGWIVARRFSQFHKLNEYLKKRYNEVNDVQFPKKNISYLKFQKTQQIETRKPLLEKYLQDLLALPDVCSDPAFRSFLSSENFSVGKTQFPVEKINNSFFRQPSRDPGIVAPKKDTLQVKQNEEILLNIKEMERELKQFDEIQKNVVDKVPFVKPISDLLLTVFDLSRSNWLRGRALLVILQQVLGSTIERTLITQIEQNIKQEENIADVLQSLQDMLFPGGKFRESPELRTKSQQVATRKEAYTILQIFMSETCSKIFGVRNTNQACINILEMGQNDYLNKHLMFEILDIILESIFPEVEAQTS